MLDALGTVRATSALYQLGWLQCLSVGNGERTKLLARRAPSKRQRVHLLDWELKDWSMDRIDGSMLTDELMGWDSEMRKVERRQRVHLRFYLTFRLRSTRWLVDSGWWLAWFPAMLRHCTTPKLPVHNGWSHRLPRPDSEQQGPSSRCHFAQAKQTGLTVPQLLSLPSLSPATTNHYPRPPFLFLFSSSRRLLLLITLS